VRSPLRLLSLLALAPSLLPGCSKPAPAPAVDAAATTVDTHAHDCAALADHVAAINKKSVDFGVANKADGGTLVDLWRGFSRFAEADARTAPISTDPAALRWELRLLDVRRRSAPAFSALADAVASGDRAAESEASARVKALGAEWKDLESNLRAGCP
jgi:hypothetical protein